jgi:hypothetical protein
MRQFKWIEWNLQKIDAHGLSAEEVEAALDRVFSLRQRKDGSFQMFAPDAVGPPGLGDLAVRPGGRPDPGCLRRVGRTADLRDHRLLRGKRAMTTPEPDQRSPGRRARDDEIAAEPQMPPPELPADAPSAPVENHLAGHRRRTVAVAGVVENGLVRPLDPGVKLRERSRVIIVASSEESRGP